MANSSSLAAQNRAALDYFVQGPVTTAMVSYLAAKASSVIKCEVPASAGSVSGGANGTGDGGLPTPPTTPSSSADTLVAGEADLPPLEEFITSIIQQSHVQVPTLMPALVYLDRLRSKLPPVAQGIPSTVHRIFLAALVLAAKNLNDSSPKNKHWARYTAVPGYPGFGFTNTEVNLMEKQLLYLLDWDLRITNEDLYYHLDPFLAPIRVRQQQHAERKLQAALRERERTAQLQRAHAQFELRQEQLRQEQLRLQQQQQQLHARSISALASAHAQVHLPHVVSQARLSRYHDMPQQQQQPLQQQQQQHYRAASRALPSRTPSLSPPTRHEGSASYDSSASASPASFVAPSEQQQQPAHYQPAYTYPAKPQEARVQVGGGAAGLYEQEMQQPQYAYPYAYSYEVPEVVHIRNTSQAASIIVQDKAAAAAAARPYTKPVKKVRSSAGSLIARFLGGGGGSGYAQAGTAC